MPAGSEPCRCAQVSSSWYPMDVLLPQNSNSWSTWNSLCCSSGASCSPVLLLAPGISTGIKLVRLGWIQVLQVWILQSHLDWGSWKTHLCFRPS